MNFNFPRDQCGHKLESNLPPQRISFLRDTWRGISPRPFRTTLVVTIPGDEELFYCVSYAGQARSAVWRSSCLVLPSCFLCGTCWRTLLDIFMEDTLYPPSPTQSRPRAASHCPSESSTCLQLRRKHELV